MDEKIMFDPGWFVYGILVVVGWYVVSINDKLKEILEILRKKAEGDQ